MIGAAARETCEALLDGLTLLLCGISADGRILAANRRCAELAGLGDDLAGRDWCDVFASPERHARVAELWQTARGDRPSEPFEALCPTGHRVRWQFSRWGLPEGDVAGGELAVCAVGIDITHQREHEARKRTLDRVTALANLGAGLAHNLRNPLNSASLQLALAERKLAQGSEDIGHHVARASRELVRMSRLLDDFLSFARPQGLELVRVDPESVIARAVEAVRPRAEAAGVAIVRGRGASLTAELDPARIEGALVQLLSNAIDASAAAEPREVGIDWHVDHNALVFEVRDRGPGLPSPDAPIFDPFFTTKPAGTGLGLAIVERAASDHGGAVVVERVGDATVFGLRIPVIVGVL